MATAAVVRAVNALAARWAQAVLPAEAATRDTVFSPVGVWPLLAALAAGADGHARQELEEAVGMGAAEAMAGARDLMTTLRRLPGVSAALGLWTREKLQLEPGWALGLPEGTHGLLTGDPAVDKPRLDEWAKESTDGRIEQMPVAVGEETLLVLASGLLARTRWLQPFFEIPHIVEHGPWAGRDVAALVRSTGVLDRAALLTSGDTAVTELRVLGNGGIDVHLLLGKEQATPAAVLAAGLDGLAHPRRRTAADRLPTGEPGPGLSVRYGRSFDREPELTTTVVPFDLDSEHDLLADHAVFGLTSARDDTRGHFSGISLSRPLAVGSARQSAMTKFTARGFEAAAVTAIGMVGGAGAFTPRPTYRVRQVEVTFDRPHGFLAVHRTSRLVLAAGWVGTARDYEDAAPWD
ncbi:serpin family protein [Streptacidiphilus jiangxiensis]|uniref:Serine protease inhibitor n=1 Tax=Streptacidiphilus jiangxiensis TaxID=235985 RepID=A0A1H7Z9K9_STRJI|nr:serpin family protein [Streptacidiphilus jiangxiensis]SEM54913.1 Serine protease inhibitor [Streptacidiphilus jiangxiensis]